MPMRTPRGKRSDQKVAHLHPKAPGDSAATPGRAAHAHRWTKIGALALVALAAIYGIAQWILGPGVPTYTVRTGNIVQTVVASGRVETPLRVSIGSQITGTVAAIPVEEGQSVTAHQLLIALEDSEAKASVAAAQAAVVQAEARLKQIRDVALPTAEQALRRAQANLANSRKQYERMMDLAARKLVSQQQVDDAEMNREIAESEVRTAQLQVESNRPTGSDYAVANTALEQARANLTAAQAKLRYTTIEAPVDGTLIARDVESGDVVQPGKTLMVLSPAGQTQLVVQIDEKNLASLKVGQPALGSADAYPDQQFRAEIVYINPAIDAERGSVEVKLKVPDAPEYLRQDMTVSVDIEVARRTGTLIVAADAIHDATGASPWVMKRSNGRVQRQAVKLGARGSGEVEIVAGLQAGDEVVAASNTNLTEGKRVRAVPANTKTAPRR